MSACSVGALARLLVRRSGDVVHQREKYHRYEKLRALNIMVMTSLAMRASCTFIGGFFWSGKNVDES